MVMGALRFFKVINWFTALCIALERTQSIAFIR